MCVCVLCARAGLRRLGPSKQLLSCQPPCSPISPPSQVVFSVLDLDDSGTISAEEFDVVGAVVAASCQHAHACPCVCARVCGKGAGGGGGIAEDLSAGCPAAPPTQSTLAQVLSELEKRAGLRPGHQLLKARLPPLERPPRPLPSTPPTQSTSAQVLSELEKRTGMQPKFHGRAGKHDNTGGASAERRARGTAGGSALPAGTAHAATWLPRLLAEAFACRGAFSAVAYTSDGGPPCPLTPLTPCRALALSRRHPGNLARALFGKDLKKGLDLKHFRWAGRLRARMQRAPQDPCVPYTRRSRACSSPCAHAATGLRTRTPLRHTPLSHTSRTRLVQGLPAPAAR